MKYGSGLKVVIVSGRPGVGKTTFEDICTDILGWAYCDKRSTVDLIKEIAADGGWHNDKSPRGRKFLSDLKDLFTEYNDMPLKDIVNYLDGWELDLDYYNVGDHPHILFVDDREPEHIERVKKELNAITLLIRRPGDEKVETSNHADRDVFNYSYDYVINNDGDLNDLKEQAAVFINSIFS